MHAQEVPIMVSENFFAILSTTLVWNALMHTLPLGKVRQKHCCTRQENLSRHASSFRQSLVDDGDVAEQLITAVTAQVNGI